MYGLEGQSEEYCTVCCVSVLLRYYYCYNVAIVLKFVEMMSKLE